ncbi:MAG TPA: hypothetical protein VLA71_16725 [Algoriphagus sp.]|nr:hypothetical protein [Algoriphagus sp.]
MRKIDLFALVGLVILVSCSERKTFEQDFLLDISDRKKFFLGKGGLTSEPFYYVSLDSTRSKGVIYNRLAHSLDSLFVSPDSAWIKEGDIMEIDGPYGVGSLFSFFATKDHLIFMNSQQFFNQNRETKEVSMKFMNGYGIFGDTPYLMVSVPTAKSSHEFYGLDKNSGVGYFVFDDDRQVRVFGYSPSLDSMFFAPVVLDSQSYFKLRFKVTSGNLILGGNDAPQISIVGSNMIVTYPSFSDFLVHDLRSQDQKIYSSKSVAYASARVLPQNYSNEVSSGELQFELEKAMSAQVRYGYMDYLESVDKYIRLVKGEGGANSHFFLEVFDGNFQKLNEIDLSEINPDLSGEYVNTTHGLMFRAQDQPEEDVMYYYYINLIKGNN